MFRDARFVAQMIGFLIFAPVATASEWMPLAVGNAWAYAVDDASEESHLIAVRDTLYDAWYRLEGHPLASDRARWFTADAAGLHLWRGHYEHVIPDDIDVGDAWTTAGYGPCNSQLRMTLIAAGDTLSTAAGTFDDTRVIAVESQCEPDGLTSLTLARGVGIVAYEMSAFDGEHRYTLVRAQVGDASYPGSGGIEIAASTDRQVFVHGNHPAVMSLRLTLRNASTRQLVLRFPTQQKQEIVVTAAEAPDVVLVRWSLGRRFSLRDGVVRVNTDEAYTVSLKLPLADEDGERLAVGAYIATASLPGTGFEARLPLWVK